MLDLYLANGDGTQPQLYELLERGLFLSWSPDGKRFLYVTEQAVHLGAPAAEPLRLGGVASVFAPRWLTANRIVYLQDTGAAWMLMRRGRWQRRAPGDAANRRNL